MADRSPRGPPPLLMPMRGLSMSPRAWKESESHDLPLNAPELIKPSPYARMPVAPSPRSDVPLQEPSPRTQRIALDAAAEDVPSAVSPPLDPSPPAKKPPSLRMAAITAHLAIGASWSPRTADEVALAAGELSGARVCQALLQRNLAPQSFGRCVTNMPRELLLEWLEGFGRNRSAARGFRWVCKIEL